MSGKAPLIHKRDRPVIVHVVAVRIVQAAVMQMIEMISMLHKRMIVFLCVVRMAFMGDGCHQGFGCRMRG